jgi:hypothetical protein
MTNSLTFYGRHLVARDFIHDMTAGCLLDCMRRLHGWRFPRATQGDTPTPRFLCNRVDACVQFGLSAALRGVPCARHIYFLRGRPPVRWTAEASEYLQAVFTATTRGLALYFITLATLYMGCKDRKHVALPAVEFHSALFYLLWLAFKLAGKEYRY